jgi:hypothetical protein
MVSKTNLSTVECKNLQSAFRNPDIVDNLIKQEVEKGYHIEKRPKSFIALIASSILT